MQCPYPRVCQMTNETAEVVGVEGKTILVIGSQSPWLESILISRLVLEKLPIIEKILFIEEQLKF